MADISIIKTIRSIMSESRDRLIMRFIEQEKQMKQYIVDAFTDKIFSGNPAAVCVLDSFPSEDINHMICN